MFWFKKIKPSIGADRRDQQRFDLCLEVEIDTSAGRMLAIVTDVSRYGFHAQVLAGLPKDARCVLIHDALGRRSARVMWTKPTEFGCHFNEPLDVADLNTVLSQCARSFTLREVETFLAQGPERTDGENDRAPF